MLAPNIKTAKTKYGDIAYYADDEYIGRALEKYGAYSEAEIELWRKVVKPGDTVVDVGANIGALTLPLTQLVGEAGYVFAFEPQPENYQLLDRNTEGHDNIETFDGALGAVIGNVLIPRLTNLGHHNYGRVELGTGDAVNMRTLDSYEFDRVDFIKIDVEGLEADVLLGAHETIMRCRPLLYVEADRPEKRTAILNALRACDYRCYDHLPPIYPDQNIVSLNVLAVPQERKAEFAAVTDILKYLPAAISTAKWAGICRFGGIGDNLIAASVLKPLKAMGYKLDVLTQEPQSCIFENNPYIDKLSVKNGARDLPPGGSLDWQKWFWSRGKEYDRFVNLSHSCENLGALFPASTAFWWSTEFRRKLCGRSYLELVHDIAGVPYDFGPLFFPTDDEREQAQETKRKLTRKKTIGWCITGTRVDKVYSGAPVAVARLIKEFDVDVVLLGAPQPSPDFSFATQTRDHVVEANGSDNGLHLALSPDAANPSWPIRRLLTLAQACDLVIGPDTGPMWAVAMEPMPKIVMVSHASAENITKHWANTTTLHGNVPCHPCHRLHDGIDTCIETQREAGMPIDPDAKGAACMRAIKVDSIIKTVNEVLQ